MDGARLPQNPKSLGRHPKNGLPIFVSSGQFGPYVQLGNDTEGVGDGYQRAHIPRNWDPSLLTLDQAVQLLNLPTCLGQHPRTNKHVSAGVGRFGPYVVHDGVYQSFGKEGLFQSRGQPYDVLTVDLEAAIEMLKIAEKRPGRKNKSARKKPPDGETL